MITFADKYPELVVEWASDNNVRPETISYGSNRKIIWNGRCGHRWEATAKNRGNGSGCPFCSGNKILLGFNDLAYRYPDLASEWSDRNGTLLPSQVAAKSNLKVWWKCKSCGQQWQARIADRTDGSGCPVCTGEKLVPGLNDLNTLYPDIAAEWSDRNKKKPDVYWPKSRENVWWKCGSCGYEWKAVINTRVKGMQCPECARRIRFETIPYINKEEERRFRVKAVEYYARQTGAEILVDADDIIGVMLDVYFPDQRAAILYSSDLERECLVRRERAVNWLCFNAGIKLFRILPNGANEYDNCVCITLTDRSLEVLSMALQVIFDMLGLQADVDLVSDCKKIKKFSEVAQNAT